jgi:hypothetical protein
MGQKSAEEILGVEFDWLCCDVDSHVALFSTAGAGYAPEEFLRDTDAHDAAIDSILLFPASTIALFAPDLPVGLKNTWRLVAERGLFAFDSDPNGGPYRLVAAPKVPVRVAELPKSAAAVVSALQFGNIRFTELSVVPAAILQHRGQL